MPLQMTKSLALTDELISRAQNRLPSGRSLDRLRIHKMAYFAQAAGASTSWRFHEYEAGPFDRELDRLIQRLEDQLLREGPTSQVHPHPRILEESARQEASSDVHEELSASLASLDAAIDLLSTADLEEAELLSTTYFAWNALLASGEVGSVEEIVDFIQCWSAQKKEKFGPRDIERAVGFLAERGWMGPTSSDASAQSGSGDLAYFP